MIRFPARAALAAVIASALAVVAVPTASAVGVTDAFKLGYQAYSKYKACMANVDAGQPCLASDSQNIRQILKDVAALRTEIAANHANVTAQLNLLQATLDNKIRNDYVEKLTPVIVNVPEALRSYQGLMRCADARAHAQPTCLAPDGTQMAAAEGITRYQDALIFRDGLMNDDIRSTAAIFSGTAIGGDNSGLLAADWMMHKNVQQNDAGTTNATVMAAMKVPVLTAGLGNATTKFGTTLDDILESYGTIKPFVAGLRGRNAVAEEMQSDARDAIYGADAFSVASRVRKFTLPRLESHEIAFINKADGKAWIMAPIRRQNRLSGYLINPTLVFHLGRAVNAYGVASTFREKRPAAFPSDGWYPTYVATHRVLVCPRTETFCPSANREFWVDQLARSSSEHVVTSMRLENARPQWNTSWRRTAYGTMGVDFRTDFEHFVAGPASFDWYVYRYQPSNIGIDYTVGPGAWVRRSHVAQAGLAVRLATTPPMMG